jgi:hypothetical protein
LMAMIWSHFFAGNSSMGATNWTPALFTLHGAIDFMSADDPQTYYLQDIYAPHLFVDCCHHFLNLSASKTARK